MSLSSLRLLRQAAPQPRQTFPAPLRPAALARQRAADPVLDNMLDQIVVPPGCQHLPPAEIEAARLFAARALASDQRRRGIDPPAARSDTGPPDISTPEGFVALALECDRRRPGLA